MTDDLPPVAPLCDLCEAEPADMSIAGANACDACLKGIFDAAMAEAGAGQRPH